MMEQQARMASGDNDGGFLQRAFGALLRKGFRRTGDPRQQSTVSVPTQKAPPRRDPGLSSPSSFQTHRVQIVPGQKARDGHRVELHPEEMPELAGDREKRWWAGRG
jgi:hypothetical protein